MPKGTTIRQRTQTLARSIPTITEAIGQHEPTPAQSWASVSADPAVRAMCEDLGLDFRRPSHLSAAFKLVCKAYRGAAPQRWDSFSLTQLLMNFLRLRVRMPRATDRAIYIEMSELRLYKEDRPETLGRAVRNALDPEQNKLLRDALAMMPEAVELMNRRRKRSPLPDWQSLPYHFYDFKSLVN